MNKSRQPNQTKRIADLFRILGQPARLRILMTIGKGEACVCHLEAVLGLRQAYISQQLMALREADLVNARRSGRNIYYRLEEPHLLDLLREAAQILDIPEGKLPFAASGESVPNCSCPHCTGEEEEEELISPAEIGILSNE